MEGGWKRKAVAGIPPNVFYHAGLIVDEFLFVFGGRTRRGDKELVLDNAYCLDLSKDGADQLQVFERVAPCPVHTSCATALAAQGDSVLLLGGSTVCQSDHLFRTDEKRWETLLATEKQDLAPLDRFGHSAVLADDDTVVTFGGSSREGTKTKTNSLLRLRFDEDQRGEWDEIIPTNAAPTPRSFHTAVLIEEDMYIFGGVNQDGVYLNDLYIFNLETLTWSKPPVNGVVPKARCSHSCIFYEGFLFIFGGVGAGGLLNDLHIYDTATNSWQNVEIGGDVPEARKGHCADIYGSEMLIFGGFSESGDSATALCWIDLDPLLKRKGPYIPEVVSTEEDSVLYLELDRLHNALNAQVKEAVRLRHLLLRIKGESEGLLARYSGHGQLSPEDAAVMLQRIASIAKLADIAAASETKQSLSLEHPILIPTPSTSSNLFYAEIEDLPDPSAEAKRRSLVTEEQPKNEEHQAERSPAVQEVPCDKAAEVGVPTARALSVAEEEAPVRRDSVADDGTGDGSRLNRSNFLALKRQTKSSPEPPRQLQPLQQQQQQHPQQPQQPPRAPSLFSPSSLPKKSKSEDMLTLEEVIHEPPPKGPLGGSTRLGVRAPLPSLFKFRQSGTSLHPPRAADDQSKRYGTIGNTPLARSASPNQSSPDLRALRQNTRPTAEGLGEDPILSLGLLAHMPPPNSATKSSALLSPPHSRSGMEPPMPRRLTRSNSSGELKPSVPLTSLYATSSHHALDTKVKQDLEKKVSRKSYGRQFSMFRKKRTDSEVPSPGTEEKKLPAAAFGADHSLASTPTAVPPLSIPTSSAPEPTPPEHSPRAPMTEEELRNNVFQELLTTEQTYVADVEIIIKLFKQNNSFTRMLSTADVQAVFAYIEPIFQINKMLLQHLEDLATQPFEQQNMGIVFLEMVPFFKVYNDYCVNHSRATKTLIRLRKSDPALQEYLEAMRAHPHCKFLDLESLLIKPLQRVCRYPLLVKEYIKRMPKEHPSYPDLLVAESALTEFLDSLNQRKRENEHLDELFELASAFKWDGKPAVKIVKPGRKMLHRGSLKKIVEEPNRVIHRPHLFLMSDLLLLAKEKGKRFVYVDHVPIHACLIYSQDKTMNSFTLARLDNKQKLGIFSDSDEERESWVNAITDCMSANLTALRAGGVVPYSNEL